MKDDDRGEFLKELPTKLQTDLAYIIHKEDVAKFPFFIDKSKNFIAAIAPMLKPIKILKGGFIYEEGDPADSIYFLLNGVASLVIKDKEDIPFLVLEEGKIKELKFV